MKIRENHRVVVTAIGVRSALGNTPGELFDALAAGCSAVRRMEEWYGELQEIVLAAPVIPDPVAERSIERKFRRSMGPAAIFGALAAQDAVQKGNLTESMLTSGRIGCVMSSTMGSSSSIVEATATLLAGRRQEMGALQFFKCVSHSSAFNVANLFGIRGVQLAPCSACASSLQSIGCAMELIASGRQDAVLAGGSDEVTSAVAGSFELLFALAGSGEGAPEAASRPFDAARSGLVCGEGAAVLLLESLEHAKRRGAPILFELIGYATNSCGVHVSQSDAGSIERCLREALDDAGVPPEQVDYVSCHATATQAGDREEAAALRAVFGDSVAVSSLKGHLGHTLGASGAIELAAVGEMLRRGQLLPTRNLEHVADDCAGLDHVTELRERDIRCFVKNSIAFGGVNAVLVGAPYEE